MIDLDLAHVFIAVMMIGSVLLWLAPAPCRCDHCAYHKREREEAERKQKALQHDVQHRGWGRDLRGPDIYSCNNPACDRNPKGPTEL